MCVANLDGSCCAACWLFLQSEERTRDDTNVGDNDSCTCHIVILVEVVDIVVVVNGVGCALVVVHRDVPISISLVHSCLIWFVPCMDCGADRCRHNVYESNTVYGQTMRQRTKIPFTDIPCHVPASRTKPDLSVGWRNRLCFKTDENRMPGLFDDAMDNGSVFP